MEDPEFQRFLKHSTISVSHAGFTCGTEGDMVIKHAAIAKARTSIAMCDRTKFSRLMPYTFAKFSDIDYLITDGDVPEPIKQSAIAEGVTIL